MRFIRVKCCACNPLSTCLMALWISSIKSCPSYCRILASRWTQHNQFLFIYTFGGCPEGVRGKRVDYYVMPNKPLQLVVLLWSLHLVCSQQVTPPMEGPSDIAPAPQKRTGRKPTQRGQNTSASSHPLPVMTVTLKRPSAPCTDIKCTNDAWMDICCTQKPTWLSDN